MRQVFRLMGMPDRVIAFDELPNEYVQGLELCDCSKLPKDWREFIGIREKVTRIPPDRDPLTGQLRTYTPIVQKAPYAYLIDWEINSDRERWQEIESYVRRNAPKDFRLMDKLGDMAKPLARDAHSELDLETEHVVVIPLSKVDAAPEQATVAIAPEVKAPEPPLPDQTQAAPQEPPQPLKITPVTKPSVTPFCDICNKEFSSKQAVRMHVMKKHSEQPAENVAV